MIEALRRWAARYTVEGRYSPVGGIFHWVMAALIVFQLWWGWSMGRMEVGGDKLAAYRVHAEIGMLMFALALLRALWRLMVPGPVNDADRLGWQTLAAYVTHVLFYICFFGLPLSGWAMWSALGGEALSVWPSMPLGDLDPPLLWWILYGAERLHALLILLLLVMIPMHVGAALKHHFWDRHDVLRGMLPELPEDAAPRRPRSERTPRAPLR